MNEPELSFPLVIDIAIAKQQVSSANALGTLAADRGLGLNRKTAIEMHKGRYRQKISAPTAHALAVLSGIAEADIRELGRLAPHQGSFKDLVPDDADAMLPHQREAALAVIRGFVQDAQIMYEQTRQEPHHVQAEAAEEEHVSGPSEAQKITPLRGPLPFTAAQAAAIASGYEGYELVAANPEDDNDDNDEYEGA